MTWLSSIHTHTAWCDGKSNAEALCQSALDKGFVSLGIGGHGPIPLPNDCNMKEGELPSFRSEVRAAQEAFKGRLEVFMGLEIDFIEGISGPADGRLKRDEWDYFIGSVHYLSPKGYKPFAVDGPLDEFTEGLALGYGGDIQALVLDYWRTVQEMVEAGGFDLVGHLDLIKKHNRGGKLFDTAAPWYQEAARKTISLIADKNLVCEVNTGGLARKRCDELYPSPAILALLKEAGVTISIQSDAHDPDGLDAFYREARESLRAQGWKEHAVFASPASLPYSGPPPRRGGWQLKAID